MIHSKYYKKDYTKTFIRLPYLCLVISIIRLLFIRFLYSMAHGATDSTYITVYLMYFVLLMIQTYLCLILLVSYLNCDKETKMINGKECNTLLCIMVILEIVNLVAFMAMLAYNMIALIIVASIIEVLLSIIYFVFKRRYNNGRKNSF